VKRARWLGAAVCLLVLASVAPRVGAQVGSLGMSDAPIGLQSDVVFTGYAPLARSDELMRRFLTPLVVDDLLQRATSRGMVFDQQAVDLTKEHFAVFVPSQPPRQGYALMVFVPPWEKAFIPPDWIPPLEKHGMIFVTAAQSGNTQDILQRRNPLALLGAYNIMQRYHVDPSRVYVGGMSGGSRVALRLALSYPDLFRGAFLHSGSDPIGNVQAPLPSVELFHKFQESTRVVFFTGQTDIANLYQDDDSRQSLRQWCVFDLYDETIPFIGHELGGGHDFEHAITALQNHVDVKPETLAKCREHHQRELTSKLDDVRRYIAKGKTHEASSLLKTIDTRYAGLAAPDSVELARELISSH
jgi:hypothetical protein